MRYSPFRLLSGLGRTAIGESIERLVTAGFVERRASEIDRRSWNIFLTPEGRRAVTKLHRVTLRVDARIAAGVSPAEVREALRILEIIKTNLLDLTRN